MGVAQNNGRNYRVRAAQGFSLIELLIVVAIILIIAAIAIPNLLRARMAASESAAADAVRQITRAEVAYSIAYPAVGYANILGDMGGVSGSCVPATTSACLIDSSLSGGLKGGYQFLATGIFGSAGGNTAFVVGSTPITFNKTGVREFCTTTDTVLRAQVSAAGNLPVTTVATCSAFPAAQ
jgi:prepilin-type N-terminal cleavage/methylation domain-containing protein